MQEFSLNREKFDIRENADGTVTVSGYAAKFNQLSHPFGSDGKRTYFEKIAPGAFSRALNDNPVHLLAQHDGLPLASTKSGTLQLAQDHIGLRMEAKLDGNDPDVRAIVPKIKRGDLSEMSFGFTPSNTKMSYSNEGNNYIRQLDDVNLIEVSMVASGQYPNTELKARSLSDGFDQSLINDEFMDIAAEIKALKESNKDIHNERFGGGPRMIV